MDTPFLGLFKAPLNGMSRCHFRRPLSNERTLAVSEEARRPPKNRDNTKHKGPERHLKRKIIGFEFQSEKYIKMLKSKTPVTDRPLPEFQEMQKKTLFSKKNCNFAWEGWSKLKIDYFLLQSMA